MKQHIKRAFALVVIGGVGAFGLASCGGGSSGGGGGPQLAITPAAPAVTLRDPITANSVRIGTPAAADAPPTPTRPSVAVFPAPAGCATKALLMPRLRWNSFGRRTQPWTRATPKPRLWPNPEHFARRGGLVFLFGNRAYPAE